MSANDGRAAPASEPLSVEIDGRLYHPCTKPDCGRVVALGVVYCCAPCAEAAEDRCEIDEHSDGCEARWQQRRPHLEARA